MEINSTVKANRVFKDVNQSKCRYIVMKGSAGSGKSVDTAQNYILRLTQEKGRNLLCVRKSEVTNRDSTFAELKAAVHRLGLNAFWTSTVSPLGLKCINGNSILFRGINDENQREKIKSINVTHGKLTDIWIEEATELSQSDVEILDDRLRGELPEPLFYQMRLTFNPVSKEHWIKKVYFDREDPQVFTHHSTYLDNRFIDEAYKKRMERRAKVDPDGYRIYGLGEWGEVGGLILTNYQVKDVVSDLNYYDSVVLAQDFGFNHANVILLVGFKDGILHVLDELCVWEKDTSEIIALAEEKRFSKALPMYCDSAEPDRIKMWQKAGFNARGVVKGQGSVQGQISHLKTLKIDISPKCVNTIKEITQWRYKKNTSTGKYEDEPIAIMDDCMAALRYSIEEFRKGRPIEFSGSSVGI